MSHTPNSKYIYYDLQLYNFNNDKTDRRLPLVFDEARSNYFIHRASDYKMSIVRFELDTFGCVPIYEAEIVPNQADINLTTSILTLEYDDNLGNVYTSTPTHIIWIAQDKTQPLPNAPNTTYSTFQEQTAYYYAYSFQYVIDLINTALLTAWTELQTLVISGVLKYVEAPFLQWNKDLTASLYVREEFFNQLKFPQVRIYFNRPLYALFNTFSYIQYSISSPNNKIYLLSIKGNLANTIYFEQNNNPFIKVDQEETTIKSWSPVSSIVFTTGTLPVNRNELSSPIQFINGQVVQLASSNAYNQPVITDFIADDLYTPTLLYIPSVYRYISLVSERELNQVDILVHFRDKRGQLQPISLPVGGSCSMKILFEQLN
jgi:hypothetical protein